ncbi:metallophosphoesterase family protein [Zooshikella marina]|uniref:metallophosphoesterase family protein n=1 Tax=Zooshikella ganghwensis TaxID=202772 RepID=UPI001BAFCA76|nr:metallophosphoesterase family protein [Zooshikella ganghwensis]MBU2708286.1 metallophosphoesterase family protein [Zooshikella ganghwensis]
MKMGVISDVHGNYVALQRVLKALETESVDAIYCLGDIVGYYPQVNECCRALRQQHIHCIMGNHDWYMVGGYCARSKSVNICIDYQRSIIDEDHLNWLSTLPLYRTVNDIHMLHGGWTNPLDEYLKPEAAYFSKLRGQFFFSGHTHRQILCDYGDQIYCNPGSVGQPRDNDPRAAYAIWDHGDIQLFRIEYPVDEVFKLMNNAGFDDYYYGCLLTGASHLCKLPPDYRIS